MRSRGWGSLGNSMDGGACAGHRPLGEGGRWVRKGLARLGQQWSRRAGNWPCPWPWAPSGGSPKTLPGSVAPEQWRLRVHHDTGGLGEPRRGSEQEGSGCPSSARARHTRGQTWGPKARANWSFPGRQYQPGKGSLAPSHPGILRRWLHWQNRQEGGRVHKVITFILNRAG